MKYTFTFTLGVAWIVGWTTAAMMRVGVPSTNTDPADWSFPAFMFVLIVIPFLCGLLANENAQSR